MAPRRKRRAAAPDTFDAPDADANALGSARRCVASSTVLRPLTHRVRRRLGPGERLRGFLLGLRPLRIFIAAVNLLVLFLMATYVARARSFVDHVGAVIFAAYNDEDDEWY